MLYTENLDEIIFARHEFFDCDELIVISGYVGPTPIHRTQELPFKTTVIYGMYASDGIQRSLHNAILKENTDNKKVDVLYSTVPVHSKCYIWRYHGKVQHALVGSANFSISGICTPFKESLAETTKDTFNPLNSYYEKIREMAIPCTEAVFKENKRKSVKKTHDYVAYDPNVCSLPLYVIEDGKCVIQKKHGLNWGMSSNKLPGGTSHTNPNDACIRLGVEVIKHYQNLFPEKAKEPSVEGVGKKGHRNNDNIEIIWDDGTVMTALLEGSQPIDIDDSGIKKKFPKQLSSTPNKKILGEYIRKRINVPEGIPIKYEDLEKYGRTSIDISLQGDGVYYFDFSTK